MAQFAAGSKKGVSERARSWPPKRQGVCSCAAHAKERRHPATQAKRRTKWRNRSIPGNPSGVGKAVIRQFGVDTVRRDF